MTKKGNLKSRTITGAIWLTLGKGIARSLDFIKLVVISHFLAPADLGVFGIALLVIGLVETFSETGFDLALVQQQGKIEEYCRASWPVQILRGCLLSLVIFFAAPVIADFFEHRELMSVIRLIGAVPLIRGFINPFVVFLTRDLNFKRLFLWNLLIEVTGTLVALGLLFFYRNIWPLAISLLSAQVLKTVTSYWIVKERPALTWEWSKIKELADFGQWIFGINIVVFFLIHGDDAWVGKILGAAALGIYQVAFRIAAMPATEISSIIASATYPAFASLRNSPQILANSYLRIIQIVSCTAVPLSVAIYFIIHDFTAVFMGPMWGPMAPVAQALCLYGMVRAINSPSGSIFLALGKPKIETHLAVFQLILMAALIYPFTVWWEITGVAAAIALACLACFVWACREVAKLVGQSTIKYYAEIFFSLAPGLFAGIILAALLWSLQNLVLVETSHLARFLTETAVALSFIGGTGYWIYSQSRRHAT